MRGICVTNHQLFWFLRKILLHPEGMTVNSRGRAALRDAPG